ncbi:hypothetical protein [Enterobacter roggenkampii]|uniref:hypothetical protein n=1 Tax=Enterobacter roggenkampii TaxID=1812935 RepID=UPI003899D33A
MKPIYVYLKDNPRTQPGTATGTGTQIENGKIWLVLSVTNIGEGAKIPAHTADILRDRKDKEFRQFREELLLEISKDPELSKQFSQSNIAAMGKGNAPTGSRAGFYQRP